jgi:outer membrane protein TolC
LVVVYPELQSMKTLQTSTAVLCALLVAVPLAPAQEQSASITPSGQPGGVFDWLSNPYKPKQIGPIRLANSSRLEQLLRAGKLYLSLQDAIALALENNLDIELQRYGEQISEASLMRAEAGGLLRGIPPTVQSGPQSALSQVLGVTGSGGGGGRGGGGDDTGTTGGTIITTTGTAIPNIDPVMFTSFQTGHTSRPQSNTVATGLTALTFDSSSFAYGISKGWMTGTTASFGWNNSRSNSNNPLLDFNPSRTANFQLQVSQRLLQGFGRAVNDRNIRIAKNNIRATDLQFRNQVIVTVTAIANLYWDLVSFDEDVKVKQQALALAQKLYEDNKKQVEIGTLAPIEIVSAEAQVARRQQELLQAETVLQQQETIIKNALSRTGVSSPLLADADIIPTDRIRIADVDPVRPIQDLMQTALENRPDIHQIRINIDNAKIGLKSSRSQLLPSLELQGTLQNNALVGQVNDLLLRGQQVQRNADPFFIGGFGGALGQLFRRNFPDYSIGFNFNIPIRNRSAQADMILDQLSLRQAELNEQRSLNQLRVDVENNVIALRQARARYEAALKERVLQEQTLDAEQKKYALGASTVFFVIQYQRDLAQAQSNEVAALSAYAKAQTNLHRVLGETLRVYNIDITEAKTGRVTTPPAQLPPP